MSKKKSQVTSALNYAELIHCKTADEVRSRVREWSSATSESEHLIRSTILEMHANLEIILRQILFHQLRPLLGHYFKEADAEPDERKLEKGVRSLGFASMQQLLQPTFEAYGPSDLDHIWVINDLRNPVAHSALSRVNYKGRNPFEDHDALAEVYFNHWAALQELSKFFDKRIDGPRLLSEEHSVSCTLHYNCAKGLR